LAEAREVRGVGAQEMQHRPARVGDLAQRHDGHALDL
jgi:hypothetical protein